MTKTVGLGFVAGQTSPPILGLPRRPILISRRRCKQGATATRSGGLVAEGLFGVVAPGASVADEPGHKHAISGLCKSCLRELLEPLPLEAVTDSRRTAAPRSSFSEQGRHAEFRAAAINSSLTDHRTPHHTSTDEPEAAAAWELEEQTGSQGREGGAHAQGEGQKRGRVAAAEGKPPGQANVATCPGLSQQRRNLFEALMLIEAAEQLLRLGEYSDGITARKPSLEAARSSRSPSDTPLGDRPRPSEVQTFAQEEMSVAVGWYAHARSQPVGSNHLAARAENLRLRDSSRQSKRLLSPLPLPMRRPSRASTT
ncbi:Hypothetical predicted protein [Cloeon dipterum]|uniref:Uncharacterized protein n=1 Tax=Cloeon dipterum TaxID=197152 RepID=A0A8S1D9E2_9INSE|nr:Hypothetical predicted protein [Cloeon dipterum]